MFAFTKHKIPIISLQRFQQETFYNSTRARLFRLRSTYVQFCCKISPQISRPHFCAGSFPYRPKAQLMRRRIFSLLQQTLCSREDWLIASLLAYDRWVCIGAFWMIKFWCNKWWYGMIWWRWNITVNWAIECEEFHDKLYLQNIL